MHTRIQKVSHRFRLLFQVLFWLTPVVIACFWSMTSLMDTTALKRFIGIPQSLTFTGKAIVISVVLSLIPGAIVMFGLRCLIRLFKNYEQAHIFMLDNAMYYRQLGYTFFIWVVGKWAYHLVIVYFFYPPDILFVIPIFLNLNGLISFAIGGIVILISWIMKEGYLLKQDHDLTI